MVYKPADELCAGVCGVLRGDLLCHLRISDLQHRDAPRFGFCVDVQAGGGSSGIAGAGVGAGISGNAVGATAASQVLVHGVCGETIEEVPASLECSAILRF